MSTWAWNGGGARARDARRWQCEPESRRDRNSGRGNAGASTMGKESGEGLEMQLCVCKGEMLI
jgi:hypothetical protein